MNSTTKSSWIFQTTLAAAAAVIVFGSAPAAWGDSKTYQELLRSTTWVIAKNSDGNSFGTGVLVDHAKKLMITNYHVVGDAQKAVIFFPEMDGEKPFTTPQKYLDNALKWGIRGTVIGVDRKRDLALVQLERLPERAKAIELASASLTPGETVESVGNPGSTDALWVYNSGTVRAVYRKEFRSGAGEHDFMVLETQAPINAGDSGGPVVNNQGQLVAIAQAFSSKARLVSYSVDISEVKAFLAGPHRMAPLPAPVLLTKADVKFTKHTTGHFEIQVDQDDKSKQSVFITKDIEYYQKADVRKIWSLASVSKVAPKLETTMKLLQQSARTKMGEWTIEQTSEGEFMIIYCVKMDATATPDALKSAIEYVATITSMMKKELAPTTKGGPITKPVADSTVAKVNDWVAGTK